MLGICVLPGCVLRVLGMTFRSVDGALELADRVEMLDESGMLVGAEMSVRRSTSSKSGRRCAQLDTLVTVPVEVEGTTDSLVVEAGIAVVDDSIVDGIVDGNDLAVRGVLQISSRAHVHCRSTHGVLPAERYRVPSAVVYATVPVL